MKTNDRLLDQLRIELLETENELLKYRQILAFSPDPILITDNSVRIIYVNPAWERLTGYMFSEVMNKNPKILQSGKTPKEIYTKMWQKLTQGKPFITREIIDKRKDEYEYQIHSTFFPVIKNNQTIFYVQMLHDITSQKHLELLKTEFLSVAAHEIKTPMTTVSLIAQSLLRKSLEEDKNYHSILLLNQEVTKLVNLMNDLLDISRLETGRFHLKLEKVDLVALTKEVIKKMKLLFNHHRIILDIREKKILTYADRNRIEEVLINLLTNAVKYSKENTTITITLEKKEGKVIIAVVDEGKGIEIEKLPHIFERFYQVQKYSTNGFGLGLYIAKEIVKKHKGKIWVKSTLGKGSIFYVSLPMVK